MLFLSNAAVLYPCQENCADAQLYASITAGNVALVRSLLEQSCVDVNLRTCPEGSSLACARHDPDMLEVLLAHGADASLLRNEWIGPHTVNLAIATERRNYLAAQLLVGNGPSCLTLCMGQHPRAGAMSLLRNLPQHTFYQICSFLKPSFYGKSFGEHKDLIINQENMLYNTPLHVAVSSAEAHSQSRCELVHRLIQAGADINARNGEGKTPLHVAVNAGKCSTWLCYNCFERLMCSGADVNAQDNKGRTPLLCALEATMPYDDEFRTRDILLQRLFYHGANFNLRDKAGAGFNDCPYRKHVYRAELIRNQKVQQRCVEKGSQGVRLALCCCMHPRLGSRNCAYFITTDICKNICAFLTVQELFKDPRSVKAYTGLYKVLVSQQLDRERYQEENRKYEQSRAQFEALREQHRRSHQPWSWCSCM